MLPAFAAVILKIAGADVNVPPRENGPSVEAALDTSLLSNLTLDDVRIVTVETKGTAVAPVTSLNVTTSVVSDDQ